MELTSQPSGELATLPSGAPPQRSDTPAHRPDSGTGVDQSRSAWDRHSLLVTMATIIGIVAVEGLGTRQLLACLCCALTIGFYFSTRRYTEPTAAGHRPWIALAIMGWLAVLFTVAVYFEFWAGFLMAALCPIAFFTTGMVRGHAVNATFCLVPTFADWARTGDLRHALTDVAPWSLISLAFSTLTALVVARMVGRNRADQARLAQLAAEQDRTVREVRLDAVAQERQRLAGDLHDTVTQGLASIAALVAAADRTLATEPETAAHHLQVAARAVQENLREARALVGALTPDTVMLTDALRRLAERTQRETGLSVDVVLPTTVPPLATGSQVALLRVAQEALSNVARHARAARATLTLHVEEAMVRLVIADDGEGFDPSWESPGYGLPGMRERVTRLGGAFHIDSHPGQGTRICAEVPA